MSSNEEIKYKRIFFLADIHFGIHSNNQIWQGIHRDYFEKFFIPLIQKEKQKGDCIFVLGDIFDSRNAINVATMNLASEMFEKMSQELDVFALLGNHDLYFKDSSNMNSIICIDKYIKQIYKNIKEFEFSNQKILIVPWRNNKQVAIDTETKYIFTHADINGMKYDNNFLIDEGITFPNDIIVISGHIHLRQQNRKHVYIGSPMGFTKISAGKKHGIYLLDLESSKMKFFENDVSPKHLNISYDAYMEMSEEKFKEYVKDNFIVMVLPQEVSNIFPYKKVQEIASGAHQIRFQIIGSDRNDDLEDLGDIMNEVSGYDLFQALDKYLELVDMSDDDKKTVKKEIKKIKNILMK